MAENAPKFLHVQFDKHVEQKDWQCYLKQSLTSMKWFCEYPKVIQIEKTRVL